MGYYGMMVVKGETPLRRSPPRPLLPLGVACKLSHLGQRDNK